MLTVSEKVDDYAKQVHQSLVAKGLRVDLDDSPDKLGAKIRNGRLARYPYLLVVGLKEAESGTVGVRSREEGELGPIALADFTARLLAENTAPG